jgi:long-subunit acyl-CoA synthetase (AMP-forming)
MARMAWMAPRVAFPGVRAMSAALDAVHARLPRFGSLRALSGVDETLCLADVAQRVERIALQLAAERVRVLAIAADNSPDWALVDLAAASAGIPTVPLPLFFAPGQIEHVLADCGADAIVADEPGSVPLLSLPTRFGPELTPRLTLLRLDAPAAAPIPPSTARISYTSGTTGTPKGVCLSQAAQDRVARSLAEVTGGLGIRRHLCLLPLATLLENIAGLHAPLLAGAEVALPGQDEVGLSGAAGMDVGRLLRCLHRFEPDSVILLPQMLAGLVSAVEQGTRLPASLKFAAVGGGVVGPPLLERAERAGIPVYEGYGLTECSSVVALNTPDARRRGSVGRPLPHSRVRIAGDGEVFVSGATMECYLGDECASSGEVATGDVGRLDDEGYLHISGRKKNVLITSYGRNVSPEWVEAALTAMPSIAQAALFGDAKPFNVAVVVARANAGVAAIEQDLARVNRRLPDYARVRRFILAPAPFSPRDGTLTANGRIRRDAVHERYAAAIDACYRDALQSTA